jgi:uncharacterized protein YjbJ (UPF0337 family)
VTDTAKIDATKGDMTKAGIRESIAGMADKAKGRIEDAVGAIAGDPKLQAKGKLDEAKGMVEEHVGAALRSADKKI